jgi:hypothetical protein
MRVQRPSEENWTVQNEPLCPNPKLNHEWLDRRLSDLVVLLEPVD